MLRYVKSISVLLGLRHLDWLAAMAAYSTLTVTVAAMLASGCISQLPPTAFAPRCRAVNECGDPAVADFGSRIPCIIDYRRLDKCEKIKIGITFYRDPVTNAPTTYLLRMVFPGPKIIDDNGTWTITRGTRLDSRAVVYQRICCGNGEPVG